MEWIAKHSPVIGLLIFFSVFVWVLVHTYWPGKKKEYDAHAFIPLEDDAGVDAVITDRNKKAQHGG